MKLPGIKYTTGVRSLGRDDPSMPVKLAAAEAQVVKQLTDTAGQIYAKVKEQQAINYAAESQRQLNDIEIDLKSKPAMSDHLLTEEYDTRVAQIKTQANEDLSGVANKIWSAQFNRSVNQTRLKIRSSNALNLAKQERGNAYESLTELAKGDLEAAYQGLQESPMFSAEEKKKIHKELPVIYENARIEMALTSKDPVFIQANINRMEAGQSVMQGAELRQSIGWLKSAYKEATAEATAKLEKARELAQSKLAICIDHGNCGPVQIKAAFENDTINGIKRTEFLRKWEKLKGDNAAKADRSTLLFNALDNNIPLEPGNAEHIKAVNEAYDELHQQIQQNPDPLQRSMARQQLHEWGLKLAKLNIFPKQMASDLETFAFAGIPAQAAEQANIYKELLRLAPQSIPTLPAATKAFYNTTRLMMNGGYSAEDAVKLARENVRLPPEVKAVLERNFTAQTTVNKSSLVTLTTLYEDDDQFDIGWGPFDEPEPTPVEEAAFGSIRKMFFLNNNGDLAMADTGAADEFKAIFAADRLGNKDGDIKVMPYAPSIMFPLMSRDELRQDLTKFAGANKLVNPHRVFVRPHAITARQLVKTYEVWTVDDNDDIKRTNLLWSPDIAAVRAKETEKMARAREEVAISYVETVKDEDESDNGFVPEF